MTITVEQLRQYVAYDKSTGLLSYLYSGRAAAGLTSKGYIRLKVLGNEILAHRAAWALQYGNWPAQFLDHINLTSKTIACQI